MPQYYLHEAGVDLSDFRGAPGFSGSHDKTIALVAAGAYDAGALNAQVWQARVASKAVDTTRVVVFFVTPGFHDYHWVLRPDVEQRFGAGFSDKVRSALVALDQQDILDLFGAHRFVPAADSDYTQIEAVGRAIGTIVR
jgi:phosphonate transport system substrate-binding protein